MYGIDIVSQRLSRLDKEVIKFSLEISGSKVAVEFGMGSGRLTVILGLIGFDVYAYDLYINESILSIGDAMGLSIHLRSVNISSLKSSEIPENIGIFVAERVLHFLKFYESLRILKVMAGKMEVGGRMFLSFSGINSPLGYKYPDKNKPVEERFCKLDEDVSRTFKIDVPVCLYSPEAHPLGY